MNIVIAAHVESEGPGSLGTFLEAEGARLQVVRLYDGDKLPEQVAGMDAVVSMGGPMNVYEEDKYPYLRDETDFLRKAIDAGIPVLGVCLGAQMIAKAAGAQVTRSPKEEIGWGMVHVTDVGHADVLFQGLPRDLEVFQWHGDMFHIPEKGTLLADGTDCPHQAFRIRNAFGLQFHVEVTADILSEWFADSPDISAILDRYAHVKQELEMNAKKMYTNFLGLLGK
jgi:GMP synthase-like glutamine amidotransferase